MKLFKHSSGMVVAFGFDMVARKENPRLIAWSHIDGQDWQPLPTNTAGDIVMTFDVDPDFIHEVDGRIIAYQPGILIEMTYIGTSLVWQVRTLTPDRIPAAQAA